MPLPGGARVAGAAPQSPAVFRRHRRPPSPGRHSTAATRSSASYRGVCSEGARRGRGFRAPSAFLHRLTLLCRLCCRLGSRDGQQCQPPSRCGTDGFRTAVATRADIVDDRFDFFEAARGAPVVHSSDVRTASTAAEHFPQLGARPAGGDGSAGTTRCLFRVCRDAALSRPTSLFPGLPIVGAALTEFNQMPRLLNLVTFTPARSRAFTDGFDFCHSFGHASVTTIQNSPV